MTPPATFYFGMINFVLFLGALALLLRRPLRRFFASRASAIRESVDAARQAEESAVARTREIRGRLDRLDAEVAALKQQAQVSGEQDRAAIVQRAEAFAVKSAQDTELMVTQELQRLKSGLRNTTVDLAILMAERLLREQITPDDHGRLAQAFVQRLDGLH